MSELDTCRKSAFGNDTEQVFVKCALSQKSILVEIPKDIGSLDHLRSLVAQATGLPIMKGAMLMLSGKQLKPDFGSLTMNTVTITSAL